MTIRLRLRGGGFAASGSEVCRSSALETGSANSESAMVRSVDEPICGPARGLAVGGADQSGQRLGDELIE